MVKKKRPPVATPRESAVPVPGTIPVDAPLILENIVANVTDYAVFMLDPSGRVLTWNDGAERMKGYKRDEIVGEHFSRFYEPEAVQRGWPAEELRRATESGRIEDSGWRLRKDGTRFWADVVITAIRDNTGELRGFLKITRDLTERRLADETLRESEERFRLLVESVKDYAIFLLDPSGNVISWNQGAQRIKGYTAAEIVGRHFSVFYPAQDIEAGKPTRELRKALSSGRAEDEGWRIRKDGSRFWANVIITAVHDVEGRLRGFAKVTRDLTERRRTEALEAAGREMSEFLAMLSHELRNPLAPIRNAVALMVASQIQNPTLSWARDVIDRQTALLAHLVDDLLDVTRITLGKINLRLEPTDMSATVQRAVEIARPLIELRRHHLEVLIPETPVPVQADLVRLTQVVTNLLNNAAKYTPSGGRIWLTLAREGSDAVVRVRDNGVGMTPDVLHRVFDMFVQGNQGLERSEGGLGIGLTLARKLMSLHGGSVTGRSDGPGQGSEFTVRLPISVPGRERAAEAQRPGAFSGAGRRALVVDDNPDAAQSLALLLNLWGFATTVAHDGPSALAGAADHRPDLILLDIGLPGMDGYEVGRQLRRSGFNAPILAVSGYGTEEDQQRARAAGFTDHLVKPVDAGVLRTQLEKVLAPA
jgi:PAS domain S-box-containing protein